MAEKITQTVVLDRTYLLNGRHYGPGATRVEDSETADTLVTKMRQMQAEGVMASGPDGSLTGVVPNTGAHGTRESHQGAGDLVQTPLATVEGIDAQIAALEAQREVVKKQDAQQETDAQQGNPDLPIDDAVLAQRLIDAGYDTAGKVSTATDDQLRAIPGVGTATLAKIRGAQAAG